MKRLVATAALVLALAAGSASADIFEVVEPGAELFAPPSVALPSTGMPIGVLPSADVPNAAGSLPIPPGAFEAPLGSRRELAYEELHTLWQRAGGAYGIPWQVLAAINRIESNFGRNMGPSSAGAVGWMQFIPDTWLRWGMDGSGDGIADPWDPADAVFAAARYLAAAGGATDLQRALLAYNNAQWYVDDVLELAGLFGAGQFGGVDVVFTLDRLAVTLEEAGYAVATLSEALHAAEERARQATATADAATARMAGLELLSDRLSAEHELFGLGEQRAEAVAEVERLRGELEAAEKALEVARDGAQAASFSPAAAGLFAAPTRADGYVFPVGGGPSVVSVGLEHHDYPAADIAAPLGTPVYALADAIVLATVDDGRCGIGLTLQTRDGLVWVYCHLSYRENAVQPGAFVTAGQSIGLVGSTGNSTGPHLHLGLRRPDRYPQEMPWFQEFAGIAFRWQEAGPSETVLAPVFVVMPPETAQAPQVIEFALVRHADGA